MTPRYPVISLPEFLSSTNQKLPIKICCISNFPCVMWTKTFETFSEWNLDGTLYIQHTSECFMKLSQTVSGNHKPIYLLCHRSLPVRSFSSPKEIATSGLTRFSEHAQSIHFVFSTNRESQSELTNLTEIFIFAPQLRTHRAWAKNNMETRQGMSRVYMRVSVVIWFKWWRSLVRMTNNSQQDCISKNKYCSCLIYHDYYEC